MKPKGKSQPMYWVVFAVDRAVFRDDEFALALNLNSGDGDAWFMCFTEADALVRAEQLMKKLAEEYIGEYEVSVLSFDEQGRPKTHKFCETEMVEIAKPIWS